MATKKIPVGMRLSRDAIALLREMAAQTGLSQTSVTELAIREKAGALGITVRVAGDKREVRSFGAMAHLPGSAAFLNAKRAQSEADAAKVDALRTPDALAGTS